MEKITLGHPIRVNGVEMQEVRLRRPKVRDRLIVDKMTVSDAEKEISLVANLAEISKEAVEELDLADYTQIQQKLQSFFSWDPGTTS